MKIIKTLMMPFALLEHKNTVTQIAGASILAVPASFVAWLLAIIKINVLADVGFVQSLVFLLIVDLVTGAWKHLKQKTFDWKKLYVGLLEKVFISFMGMIVFNIAGNVKELADIESLKGYLVLVGKLVNVFYVGGSAFNNMFVVSGGKFPPVGWMKRMEKFNKTASINELTKDNEKTDTDTDNPTP